MTYIYNWYRYCIYYTEYHRQWLGW